jgi:hypothetical protein
MQWDTAIDYGTERRLRYYMRRGAFMMVRYGAQGVLVGGWMNNEPHLANGEMITLSSALYFTSTVVGV